MTLTAANAPDRELVRAYILTFGNEAAAIVMADLDLFIRGNLSLQLKDKLGRTDPYALAIAEGARRILERIRSMQTMDKNPLWRAIDTERQMAQPKA